MGSTSEESISLDDSIDSNKIISHFQSLSDDEKHNLCRQLFEKCSKPLLDNIKKKSMFKMEPISQYSYRSGGFGRRTDQNYDRRNVFNFDLLINQLAQNQIENSQTHPSTMIGDRRVYLPLATSTPTMFDYRVVSTIDYHQSNSGSRMRDDRRISNFQQSAPLRSAYDQWTKIGHRYRENYPTYFQQSIGNQVGIQSNIPKPIGHGRPKDIEQDLQAELEKTKPKSIRIPPANYVCHNCKGKEGRHYVKDCPRVYPKFIKNTPYQGQKLCVGEFHCQHCKRWWLSHHSKKCESEECKKCKSLLEPVKQYPPELALKCGLYEKSKYARYRAKYVEQCHRLIQLNQDMSAARKTRMSPPIEPIGVWTPPADFETDFDRISTTNKSETSYASWSAIDTSKFAGSSSSGWSVIDTSNGFAGSGSSGCWSIINSSPTTTNSNRSFADYELL